MADDTTKITLWKGKAQEAEGQLVAFRENQMSLTSTLEATAIGFGLRAIEGAEIEIGGSGLTVGLSDALALTTALAGPHLPESLQGHAAIIAHAAGAVRGYRAGDAILSGKPRRKAPEAPVYDHPKT